MIFRILIFLVAFSSVLISQERGRNVFTLEQAIKIALEKNTDIQLYENQLSAANADLTNAFGQYLPTLGYTMGYSRNLNDKNNNVNNSANYFSIGLNANVTLFDGFSREANYKRAEETYKSQGFNFKFLEQQIRKEVYRRYINVIKNMQIVKIRRENLELGKKELERSQALFQAGTAPIQLVYSQEADLGNREFELINSENQLKISKNDLMIYMGLYPDASADFVESSIPNVISEDDINNFRREIGVLNAALDKAMKSKPEIKLYQANLEASKAGLEVAKSSYFPTLSASAGWNWANNEFANYDLYGRSTVGLNLSIPLFTNFSSNLQIQNANLRVKQSELEIYKLEQYIRQELQNAFYNLESSEKSFEVANRTVKAAKRNFDAASERLKVGSSNITDYITANAQLITSQINQINAVYSYIQAQKELLYSVGELK